jgi:hypothetical protein
VKTVISGWMNILNARVSDSGKVFDLVDENGRNRTFLADPELYDMPAVELLALWETLFAKGKKNTEAKLKPWEKAVTDSRKPRDPENDFDASGAPAEVETLMARGRADEIEPEPSEDAESESAEADAEPIGETIEFVPLPEEYEELEVD